jgi:hypothetical protein
MFGDPAIGVLKPTHRPMQLVEMYSSSAYVDLKPLSPAMNRNGSFLEYLWLEVWPIEPKESI